MVSACATVVASVLLVWASSSVNAQGPQCTCMVAGDPHYVSFDGRVYDFMGRCKYTLAESSVPNDECSFVLGGQNSDPVGSPEGPTALQWLDLVMFGNRFSFQPGRRFMVNGVETPSMTEGRNLQVMTSGSWMVFASTRCRMSLRWDGVSVATFTLDRERWGNRVRGLCGNCNNDQADDLTTRAGELVADPIPFGNSWLLNDATAIRKPNCRVSQAPPPDPCNEIWARLVTGINYCGGFVMRDGPFASCLNNPGTGLNFNALFQGCRFDVCTTINAGDMVGARRLTCDAYTALAARCSRAGVTGMQWRGITRCTLPCPANQVYATGISSCPLSCNYLQNGRPPACARLPRTEGCRCVPGFVRFGQACIPRDNCPRTRPINLFGGSGPFGRPISVLTLRIRIRPRRRRPQRELSPVEMQLVNAGIVPVEGITPCIQI